MAQLPDKLEINNDIAIHDLISNRNYEKVLRLLEERKISTKTIFNGYGLSENIWHLLAARKGEN